jgi:hypothetical protein
LEKFETLEKALDVLELFDLRMRKFFEDEDYKSFLVQVSSRMSIISQINKIAKGKELSQELKSRIKEVFEKSNQILDLLRQRMGKISERLDKRKKNKQTLKKFAY